MTMLYDLFFAFLQTGRYREARKIIEVSMATLEGAFTSIRAASFKPNFSESNKNRISVMSQYERQ